MFKKLLLSAALAVSSIMPGQATTEYFAGHQQLYGALVQAGLDVQINPKTCAEGSFDGFYQPKTKLLVICQDLGTPGGDEVRWTANDLDTLRHEAHHFVQDCVLGTNHDGQLKVLYSDPATVVQGELTRDQIAHIITTYRANGATDLILVLELEAFAVAQMNNPAEQVRDIENYCL